MATSRDFPERLDEAVRLLADQNELLRQQMDLIAALLVRVEALEQHVNLQTALTGMQVRGLTH